MSNVIVKLWIAGDWKRVEAISNVTARADPAVRFDPAPESDMRSRLEQALGDPGPAWVRIVGGEEYLYCAGAAGPFRLVSESTPMIVRR